MRTATRMGITTAVGLLTVLLSANIAWSADAPQSSSAPRSAPSKAVREKMATMHEQMAACLRSDKSIAECRSDMMKSCSETVGSQGCSMMGVTGGMGHGHMMQPPSSSAPTAR